MSAYKKLKKKAAEQSCAHIYTVQNFMKIVYDICSEDAFDSIIIESLET